MKHLVESGILGAVIGDALGVPFEFKTREGMEENPAITMVGWGTHNQPVGTWSDDTSMILATMDAIEVQLDYDKIMENFCLWLNDGKFTPHGRVFDIGRTTLQAINRYEKSNLPALECGGGNERDNGNGSLMRIIPFVFYCYIKNNRSRLDENTAIIIHNGSALTHSHPRAMVACGIYAAVIFEVIKKQNKKSITKGLKMAYKYYSKKPEYLNELKCFARLFNKDFVKCSKEEIKSSGYVVDSLEAAIWCAATTNTYEESVLKAINLGGDTDTIASLTGGITGLIYGVGRKHIPYEWMDKLVGLNYIQKMCDSFMKM